MTQLGLSLSVATALAAGLAAIGTPVAIQAARATGFLDRPTGALKGHREPTPYLGGLAVFVPFLTAAALTFELDAAFLATLLAATLACLLGLMDDFGAMRPGVKLVGQLVIVLVLLRADVRIGIEALPDAWNVALTAAWVLGVMNALNFLDVMDGLAATVALVASGWFLALALLTGADHVACVSAALFGSLLGYVRYSLPPARIFLGDAGSLFLGATLASLALALEYSERHRWAVLAPLLVLAVPAFEIAFTVIARLARGRAPWKGSPDHVALRLRRRGLGVRAVVALAAVTGLACGALGAWTVLGATPVAGWIAAAGLAGGVALAAWLWRAPDAGDRPAA